eukprot:CAMPEP_0198290516 /NCGR_PEP_ID=MMETSP1449-20131203/8351_1 /TAXON_ID=420275 /ORGANISM="Attheya septentrionalis, Strain CCMP2084" /LENGTH=141 /DNA_ID=CAMNT_0043989025 /DNA_START=206 /DNA_END=631 /DNA_ORIENTATION=+
MVKITKSNVSGFGSLGHRANRLRANCKVFAILGLLIALIGSYYLVFSSQNRLEQGNASSLRANVGEEEIKGNQDDDDFEYERSPEYDDYTYMGEGFDEEIAEDDMENEESGDEENEEARGEEEMEEEVNAGGEEETDDEEI